MGKVVSQGKMPYFMTLLNIVVKNAGNNGQPYKISCSNLRTHERWIIFMGWNFNIFNQIVQP